MQKKSRSLALVHVPAVSYTTCGPAAKRTLIGGGENRETKARAALGDDNRELYCVRRSKRERDKAVAGFADCGVSAECRAGFNYFSRAILHFASFLSHTEEGKRENDYST